MAGDACLTPDVVYLNGTAITVGVREPKAEAVAARGDRILAAGASAAVRAQAGPFSRVADLAEGAGLPPGMAAGEHIADILNMRSLM